MRTIVAGEMIWGMDATSPRRATDRLAQGVLITATLGACWLGMQAVHEFGHVAAAWASGGSVHHVVLHPFALSRTDVRPNPHPLAVAWAGPVIGTLLPCCLWLASRALNLHSAYLWRFFAAFCLVANGVYIGCGAMFGLGDAADILRLSERYWPPILFGVVSTPLGLLLWHGQGAHFGLGDARGRVDRRHAWMTAAVFLGIVLLELAGSTLWGSP